MIRVFPLPQSVDWQNCGPYGPRGKGFHYGVDLCAKLGAPLVAVDDGTIKYGTDPLGGNIAVLHAEDGEAYYYAHQSAYEGTDRPVKTGDVIGYIGNTGNAYKGPTHVHFEWWRKGNPKDTPDPTPTLMAAPRVGAPPTPQPIAKTSYAPAAIGAVVILGIAAGVAWTIKSGYLARARPPLRLRGARA